jgi:hypothetical protein
VTQALRHRGDGDTGCQHLRGHEVTKIVEPEVREASRQARRDEVLGYSVRLPRHRAIGT